MLFKYACGHEVQKYFSLQHEFDSTYMRTASINDELDINILNEAHVRELKNPRASFLEPEPIRVFKF